MASQIACLNLTPFGLKTGHKIPPRRSGENIKYYFYCNICNFYKKYLKKHENMCKIHEKMCKIHKKCVKSKEKALLPRAVAETCNF